MVRFDRQSPGGHVSVEFPNFTAMVRVSKLAACGLTAVVMPVATVTVHFECFGSVATCAISLMLADAM